MSPVVNVPQYCGLTGCWNLATVHGKDCALHPFHACSPQHAAQLRTFREQLYAEGRQTAQYWRHNWEKYANLSKFG